MLIGGIIILTASIVLLVVAARCSSNPSEGAAYLMIGGICMLGILFGVAMIGCSTTPMPEEPTALDVYRGKTTLEVTYRDSVAIDSVVVFKTK